MKIPLSNPKMGNGLVQLIRMGKYIRHKWVNIPESLAKNTPTVVAPAGNDSVVVNSLSFSFTNIHAKLHPL